MTVMSSNRVYAMKRRQELKRKPATDLEKRQVVWFVTPEGRTAAQNARNAACVEAPVIAEMGICSKDSVYAFEVTQKGSQEARLQKRRQNKQAVTGPLAITLLRAYKSVGLTFPSEVNLDANGSGNGHHSNGHHEIELLVQNHGIQVVENEPVAVAVAVEDEPVADDNLDEVIMLVENLRDWLRAQNKSAVRISTMRERVEAIYDALIA